MLNRLNGFLSLGGNRALGGLLLDFVGGGALDSRITFTRASSATRVNSSGLIESVSSNVARFDYDPVTLACKGLLIEEARTNLLLRSEEFDNNAAWSKSRSTVTANATTSPDGTVNADKLVEDTTATNTHRVYQQASKAASSLTRTFSVYLKASERTFSRITVADNIEGVTARVDIDLSAGTIGAATVSGGSTITSPSATISAAGSGWYRVTLTATFDATITSPGAFVFVCNALGGVSYTGDGSSGIFVWGAQWEDGSWATSYIPTTSATVTRAVDVPTITGTNFSSWFNQTAGTIHVEARSPGSGTRVVWQADDNTANNRYTLYTSGTSLKFDVVSGGVTQASLTLGTITANTKFKAAVAFAANDIAGVLNGGTVQTDASATLPTVDRMRLGADTTGNVLTEHIERLVTYGTRESNVQLQALTA